ncbi:MAG TPA: 6-phosphogluconolactonase, partial [Verrucomicrobiales bacterium]|nr:6-phosphogluconolactonase [Verrucomicrobiales bacterium]
MKTLLVSFLILVNALSALAKDSEIWVYFGTYTRGKESEGIYVSKLNLETGNISKPMLAAEGDNPSFVTILPDGRRLVAVEETNDYGGKSSGSLASYIIDN